MALITANQFDIVPEIAQFGRGFAQGQQIGANIDARRANRAARQRDAAVSQFSKEALTGDREALTQVAQVDPQRASQIQTFLANQSAEDRAEGLRENEVLTRTALNALSLAPEQRRAFLAQERQKFITDGRDTSNIDRALAGNDAELNQALTFQARQGQEISDIAKQQFPDPARAREQKLRSQELAIKESAEKRQATKLSAGLEKALIASQDAVIESQRSSNEFDILANQVEQADIAGGLQASTSETLKALLGTQDDVTELRRRFNKVRLSEGLRNLPPGPATDRDVQEAFKGVPPENAPASQIASFLRGAAKMARFDAAFNQFKSDFISEKSTAKGLIREWKKPLNSSVLERSVTNAEIYAESIMEGLTPEEVKAELGIE